MSLHLMTRLRCFDKLISLCCSKGVHSNSADWGPNMAALWKNTLASRGGRWDMKSWIPDIVVINLGINDLLPPASSEAEIVGAYAQLLAEVRTCT